MYYQVFYHFKYFKLEMTFKGFGNDTNTLSLFTLIMIMSSNDNPTQAINNILINYDFFFFLSYIFYT